MFQSVAAILKLFYDRSEISVTEVFTELRIPKSTASRQLQEMAQAGLLEQDRITRRYRPGPVFLAVQQRHSTGLDLMEEACKELAPLRDRFGHTGFVMSRNGTSLVLQHTLEGTGPIRVHATPRLMGGLAFFRSPGRALLARLPDEEIRAIYPASLRSTSSHSPITVDDFLERIAAVRRDGYAEIIDEGFPDVGGIAVAVAPPAESAVALNICFVAALVGTKERRSIAEALLEAGRRLGQRFGDPLWASAEVAEPLSKRSSA